MAAINQPNTKNPVLVSPVENVPVAIPSPVTQIREIPLTVVLTKYTWLDSTGEILPGHPGSVVAGSLASVFGSSNQTSILDCIANQDVSSRECSLTGSVIGSGAYFRERIQDWYISYKVNVCHSCVLAHDEVSGSREEILKAFIKWFFTLEKAQRRELISLLGDGDEACELRLVIIREANAAVKNIWKYAKELRSRNRSSVDKKYLVIR